MREEGQKTLLCHTDEKYTFKYELKETFSFSTWGTGTQSSASKIKLTITSKGSENF